MNISEKKRDSDKRAEQHRVAATMEVVQPRPNASAAQTAPQLGCGITKTWWQTALLINIQHIWNTAYVPKFQTVLVPS